MHLNNMLRVHLESLLIALVIMSEEVYATNSELKYVRCCVVFNTYVGVKHIVTSSWWRQRIYFIVVIIALQCLPCKK